ncbi:MAG TPA: ABC transporter permease [Mesotoga sp.]|jgi:peptide/nickel transport system permease protein|nr:ABC transporter permease [Mesotoga sp.]MDI9374274.1 ABC transporter permease [Thermotogota bacterium]NLX32983.1 ABC transporter permease [Thermotogaceae bacterium]MDD4039916.1 ABC transporter permease [Mesotoga sp.]MDD4478866.1 ABC transporter permease [Mesotoga sp.]
MKKYRKVLRDIWKAPEGKVSLFILVLFVFLAVTADWISPYDPYDITQRGFPLEAPSKEYPLGTDGFGVDILSQIIHGSRVSLTIGFVTGIGIAFMGGFIGVMAGTYGGLADLFSMRAVDFIMVLPGLPIMILLMTTLGSSFWVMVMIFVLFGWASVARVTRAIVLSERKRGYVEAARCAGAKKSHILLRHLLPATYSILFVTAAFAAGGSILAEAGLAFLGFGDPRLVSWGKMLNYARTYNAMVLGAWWWIIFPGIAVFLTSFSIMMLGVALEKTFNPRLRERDR